MYAGERRDRIRDILFVRRNASVSSLAESLGVSTETIRRDLASLEEEGFIVKTYGGARLSENYARTFSPAVSSANLSSELQLIAKKAVSLLASYSVVFIDHSTTASYLLDEIEQMNITVITNSLTVLNRLSGCEKIRLICCGGDFDPNRNAFLGAAAHSTLEYYQSDIAFISPAAIDRNRGFFDKTEPIAELHKAVIDNSKQIVLLMDHTKFDKVSFIHTAKDFSKVSYLITDNPLSGAWHSVTPAIPHIMDAASL